MTNRTLTNDEMVQILQGLVDQAEPPRQQRVAKMLGISDSYLSGMLNGKMPVPEIVARKLGYTLELERRYVPERRG
jgi:predicted XRE-type DNA-binding protein